MVLEVLPVFLPSHSWATAPGPLSQEIPDFQAPGSWKTPDLLKSWPPSGLINSFKPPKLLKSWKPRSFLNSMKPKGLLKSRKLVGLLNSLKPQNLLKSWKTPGLLNSLLPSSWRSGHLNSWLRRTLEETCGSCGSTCADICHQSR